ncbi:Kinesin-14 [Giardia lamblia P15]|uniref:Kinesin-like protein n=1 Tax=Giardia intestinalis (strain P15) TaxID=658858 RepID=E1F2M4_GIAIA|nr:Kinesin-14 [Giardia lamblia P15]
MPNSLRGSRSLVESGMRNETRESGVSPSVMKKSSQVLFSHKATKMVSTLSKTAAKTLAGASLSEIHSIEHDRHSTKGSKKQALREIIKTTEDAVTTNSKAKALIEQLNATDFSRPLIQLSDRANDEIARLKGQLRAQEQVTCNLTAEKESLEQQLAGMIQRLTELQTEHTKLLAIGNVDVESLQEQIAVLQATNATLKDENQRLLERERMMETRLATSSQEKGAIVGQLEALQEETRYLLAQRQLDMQERRRLHNIIQDLRGAIRVAIRLRPSTIVMSPGGIDNGIRFEFPDSATDKRLISLFGRAEKSLDGMKVRRAEHSYEFDRVYSMDATQQDVWNDVSELVQSALDGFRVCIFAYGQTASGKTHTMLGPSSGSWATMAPEDKGIMPRAVEQIFLFANETARDKWSYELTASFFEIYNDTVQDLLVQKSGGNMGKKCQIMRDANGNAYVDNLFRKNVASPEELNWLLCQAFDNRAVGSTDMNARSSRSHAIFQLDINASNEEHNQQLHGQLNLIDLAGSENVEKSGAKEERLAEAIAINKSLTALSSVICSLVTKTPHVPYRDSKLTSILQPSLSGDSKTMVVVTLAPEENNYQEAVSSLKFAARIAGVETMPKHRALRSTK